MSSHNSNQNLTLSKETDKQARPTLFARENIRQLNRSMESIEKMIEKSRRIINQSRDSDINKYSLQKYKQNAQRPIDCSREYPYIKQVALHRSPLASKTVYRQINLNSSLQNNPTSNPANRPSFNNPLKGDSFKSSQPNQRIESANKPVNQQNIYLQESQNIKISRDQISHSKHLKSSPYKQIRDSGITYKFSPQKTNKKSLNKSLDRHSAKTEKYKIRVNNLEIESNRKEKRQDILIEEDQLSPDFKRTKDQPNKEYRFKTEYQQDKNDAISFEQKRDEASISSDIKQPKKKINLKLFNTDTKKTERQKKAANIPLKLSARQTLVKQLEQLETQSANDEQRKAKFILKIKKYGFVEKHLSQQEIWSLYDKLVQSDIPEIKWPIIIVDEVYQKMKPKN